VPALYVTHDQDEAFAIGDIVLILDGGRIVRGGPPADVLADPGSAAVARFLGLGNVLDGEIVARKGRKWAVKTALGRFDVACGPGARTGQKVSILIRPERVKLAAGRSSIAARVREVIFQKNGYRVTLENGLVLRLDQAPKAREKLTVRVEAAECLE
jgi:ABC-type Fe3+/spermidine/putrescine transport system ATPase subunit